MIPAHTFQSINDELRNQARWSETKLAGVLFARPDSFLAKKEIIPNLPYFHERSGNRAHFFCCGYGAFWQGDDYQDRVKVIQIDHAEWFFSVKAFNEIRQNIESITKWEYSGETDLLLCNVIKSAESDSALDFATALKFPLGKMVRQGSLGSTEAFFEHVFSFTDTYKGTNAVRDFSQPFDIALNRFAPANIGTLWGRAMDCWVRQDYGGVLHACASVIETMAKHIVQNPKIQNQPLGGFFELYRKVSNLTSNQLDELFKIYKLRNTVPTAGHGSTLSPGLPMQEVQKFFDFTSECVRLEYAAYAQRIGTI